MVVGPEISDLIYAGASTEALYQAALRAGMVPLFREGLHKAAAGHTTVQEIVRVVG